MVKWNNTILCLQYIQQKWQLNQVVVEITELGGSQDNRKVINIKNIIQTHFKCHLVMNIYTSWITITKSYLI